MRLRQQRRSVRLRAKSTQPPAGTLRLLEHRGRARLRRIPKASSIADCKGHLVNIFNESRKMLRPIRLWTEGEMINYAIHYSSLTRICEYARALHQLHHGGGDDEVLEREVNAVCR